MWRQVCACRQGNTTEKAGGQAGWHGDHWKGRGRAGETVGSVQCVVGTEGREAGEGTRQVGKEGNNTQKVWYRNRGRDRQVGGGSMSQQIEREGETETGSEGDRGKFSKSKPSLFSSPFLLFPLSPSPPLPLHLHLHHLPFQSQRRERGRVVVR